MSRRRHARRPLGVARERIWQALGGLGLGQPVSNRRLAEISGESAESVRSALRVWVARGLVRKDGDPPVYCLIDAAPQVRLSAPARIWPVLRAARFGLTVPDLVMAAGVSRATATIYLSMLVRAGYVEVDRRGGNRKGGRARYILTRWTGPQAPVMRRPKTVTGFVLHDPNVGGVVWPETPVLKAAS